MGKHFILLIVVAALAGCGGSNRDYSRGGKSSSKAVRTASGPINQACMASERKARSAQLCGCIQAVANDHLSGSDQRIAVSFYKEPHKAQEMRQSDNSSSERFWKSYKAYGAAAEASCG